MTPDAATGTPAPARPVTPVGILAADLAAISARLEAAEGIDPGLLSDVRAAAAMAAGLDPYLARCTTPESPALARLAERTRAQDYDALGEGLEQEMLSGHVEGQVLKLLVRIAGARRVLDIGMFTGYSALAMAEGVGEEGEVVACEIDPAVAALAQAAFDDSPDGHRIRVQVGPALATLEALAGQGERFDLAFLDADKGGYLACFRLLLDSGLIGSGGLVCADNTLLQGEPYATSTPSANGAAIAAFNAAVAADPRVEQVLLPLRDGLTLIHVR